MPVSEKVFQDKGAVLRPFRARDAEAEGIAVGRRLGLQSHPLSSQKAFLEKELLKFIADKLPGLPFSLCSASEAFDLILALSGKKPASTVQYGNLNPPFLALTSISAGRYPPIHAKLSESVFGGERIILSRDLGLIERLDSLLTTVEKAGKLSEKDCRAQGVALGYPESAIESYLSLSQSGGSIPKYARLLLENDMLLTPALWNAPYIPTISGGEMPEMGHLEFWNSAAEKELGPFAFAAASAYHKVSIMELLVSNSRGETSWADEPREKLVRRAVMNAY